MKRFLQWTGVGVGLLMLVVTALFALSRWLGPTDAQQRALTRMSQLRPLPGNNAFASLWLMPYDVPAAEVATVAAQDVRAFAALGARRQTGSSGDFVSAAAQRYEDVSKTPDSPALCEIDEPDCLQKVRAQVPAYALWRDSNPALVARAALDGAGHYRSDFPARLDTPFPPFGLAPRVRLTAHAVGFVAGDQQAALDGACSDAATWRRLALNTDSLVAKLVAFKAVGGSARLFAEMLIGVRAGQPLPASCALAFAPPRPVELSMCEVMRGEFAYVTTAIDVIDPVRVGTNWGAAVFFDEAMTRARHASIFALACGDQVEQALADDQPVPHPVAEPGFRFDCVGNYGGCVLTDIARPAYHDYVLRAQDYGAHLRLAGTLLWLHEQSDDRRPLAQRLAARPTALHSSVRPIEIVEDGRALQVRHFGKGRDQHWRLPLLPAAAAMAAEAGSAAPASAN